MSFVAQVNLADTSPYDPDRLLPERGLLSFFYDSAQETYGADPEDRGGWQVLYFSSSPAHLHQVPFPASLPAEARFHPCSLHFSAELTLPSAPMQINPNLHWTQEETQRYEQMQQAFPIPKGNSPYRNRMLGYPDQLQDDMQLQAALISQGLHTIDDPGAAQAAAHKSDWILLLQLDSDANAGMRWGSAGLIDYWIKNQDLKTRKFNDTWLIMQSD